MGNPLEESISCHAKIFIICERKEISIFKQIPEKDIKPISRDTYFMVWEFCN